MAEAEEIIANRLAGLDRRLIAFAGRRVQRKLGLLSDGAATTSAASGTGCSCLRQAPRRMLLRWEDL